MPPTCLIMTVVCALALDLRGCFSDRCSENFPEEAPCFCILGLSLEPLLSEFLYLTWGRGLILFCVWTSGSPHEHLLFSVLWRNHTVLTTVALRCVWNSGMIAWICSLCSSVQLWLFKLFCGSTWSLGLFSVSLKDAPRSWAQWLLPYEHMGVGERRRGPPWATQWVRSWLRMKSLKNKTQQPEHNHKSQNKNTYTAREKERKGKERKTTDSIRSSDLYGIYRTSWAPWTFKQSSFFQSALVSCLWNVSPSVLLCNVSWSSVWKSFILSVTFIHMHFTFLFLL